MKFDSNSVFCKSEENCGITKITLQIQSSSLALCPSHNRYISTEALRFRSQLCFRFSSKKHLFCWTPYINSYFFSRANSSLPDWSLGCMTWNWSAAAKPVLDVPTLFYISTWNSFIDSRLCGAAYHPSTTSWK